MKVGYTLEHEDLQLPQNLEDALQKAISATDVAEIEPHIERACHLIDLYRNFFGNFETEAGESYTDEQIMLEESLIGFQTEFVQQN